MQYDPETDSCVRCKNPRKQRECQDLYSRYKQSDTLENRRAFYDAECVSPECYDRGHCARLRLLGKDPWVDKFCDAAYRNVFIPRDFESLYKLTLDQLKRVIPYVSTGPPDFRRNVINVLARKKSEVERDLGNAFLEDRYMSSSRLNKIIKLQNLVSPPQPLLEMEEKVLPEETDESSSSAVTSSAGSMAVQVPLEMVVTDEELLYQLEQRQILGLEQIISRFDQGLYTESSRDFKVLTTSLETRYTLPMNNKTICQCKERVYQILVSMFTRPGIVTAMVSETTFDYIQHFVLMVAHIVQNVRGAEVDVELAFEDPFEFLTREFELSLDAAMISDNDRPALVLSLQKLDAYTRQFYGSVYTWFPSLPAASQSIVFLPLYNGLVYQEDVDAVASYLLQKCIDIFKSRKYVLYLMELLDVHQFDLPTAMKKSTGFSLIQLAVKMMTGSEKDKIAFPQSVPFYYMGFPSSFNNVVQTRTRSVENLVTQLGKYSLTAPPVFDINDSLFVAVLERFSSQTYPEIMMFLQSLD